MKKGVTEHTFIFIFALIVVVMILIWGTKTIIDLKETGEQVQLADSIEDIKEKAIVYYNLEMGSSAPLDIPFPKGVDCVCFLDLLGRAPGSTSETKCSGDGAFDAWKDNEQIKNILVTPTVGSYTVTRFDTIREFIPDPGGENPLCFDLKKSRNRLKAQMISMGDHVVIKEL
ncbi:MAG: hypothetical protein ABIB47_00425 [Candidatus Woesearchaeota archaeon]